MANKNTSHENAQEHNDEQHAQLNSRLQECPIAVVGMASMFADAKNLDEYWDNIFESVDAIKDVPSDRWTIEDYYNSDPKVADKTYCKRGGFLPDIDFDPMEFGLPPNILELTDIAQLLSLVVAREVLNDAGIGDGSGYDRDKVGITLGVGGGQKQISPLTSRLQGPVLEKVLKASGVDSDDRAMIIEKFQKAYISWEENSFPGMLGNVIAGRIANRFDFGGTNCVVDAACAGSLAAIKLAISDLLEYRSEVMISGGVCCDNSPFMYMSFSKTPAFTTNNDIRPFDVDSKGMMIGEGIGMMAFKRLEDAERDGDKIYAVLKGIGTSSDGRFKSIYAPRPDGQAKALKRAYEDAGFEPKSCGLIEAHGTGTKAGDAAEFSGLMKHFSQNNDGKQHIALGSVKSQIGHTKAAAGAAGMIKAVLALHHKVLPPTLHIDQPNPALDIENSPLYLNSETRPWMPRADGLPRRAGISSFGFGGTNYHMVLEEYQPTAQGQYRLTNVAQTIVMVGNDESSLKDHLRQWQEKLTVNVDEQPYVFNALVTQNTLTPPANDHARCGFTAKNATEALAMISAALTQLDKQAGIEQWSLPHGIYYRKSAITANDKVVALFSGQGSQYVNMGRELACNFPSVMQAASDMDNEFTAAQLSQLSPVTYPIPAFTNDARKAQEEALRLTQYAQPAIGCFSVGLYKTFTNAGFKADFTAGHSFGELTALWAAGVVNDKDYMMLARSRGQAMAAPVGDSAKDFDAGTMVAVVGNPDAVANDIKDIADVSIANYNSNNQVVVAGVSAQIALASAALKDKGYKVVPLPVSAAFHTPLVGHAQKPFAKAIDSAKFNKPTMPVFANGTGKAHSNKAADIKKALKNHILESVHFNKEIDNLYDAGGRIFIEFGPKNVLTKLVENILSDKDDVVAIAVNGNAKKSADLQLRQAAVQLCVLGLSLNEIDPYSAVKRPLTPPKMSALAMKLNGASYVSEKTKKQFSDALSDGRTIKQAIATPIEKPVEKVVTKEVEKIVEKVVEKIVYVDVNGNIIDESQIDKQSTNTHSANSHSVNKAVDATDLAVSIERSVAQFVEHQQQLLSVHEQYMQGPKEYAQTVDKVLSAVAQSEGESQLPESLDRTLGMYHQFQSETLRVHEQYLNSQNDTMALLLNNASASSNTSAISQKTVPASIAPESIAPQNIAPKSVAASVSAVNAVATMSTSVSAPANTQTQVAAALAPQTVVEPSLDLELINNVMLTVVADKTGYPTEMLELGMDMEADLGIDSIKRVEILGAVQDEINDLPELNPEDLAQLRTLGEIVDYMQSKVSVAAQPQSTTLHLVETSAEATHSVTTTLNLDHIQSVMMTVVADKTGYPTEMLELAMDMEADLGIDSIKRVEILGAVQDEITDLPELNPEDLAQLRTLGEIVSYMQSKVSVVAPASTPIASTATSTANLAPAIDLDHIQSVMMTVVADKTGYPTEMLELGMDMEADLGIDSIKRVEILGAVQDEITDLPELNPEDLAQLRTLGEIVSYMQSKVSVAAPASTSIVSTSIVSTSIANTSIDSTPIASTSTLAANLAPAIDLDHIQAVMMTVVADKTGYPTEMLELGMDMEADLGIDSIKRVEILGAVQDEITNLPELNPEDLAQLRTLGEIVSYMQSKVSVAAPDSTSIANTSIDSTPIASTSSLTANSTPAIDLDHIQAVMMTVVADKTGYPTEMLELAMDMEADLGIDSIKRVEILGAVQDEITDLPELNPEDLAQLRTLGEIVSYMQSKVSVAAPDSTSIANTSIDSTPIASTSSLTANSTPAIDLDHIQSVMMTVVADKTGYPTEMLELAMDMEADLGIDSIKRVEILGAVQDEITDLPELNPEDLAQLRTLGEIVSYIQSRVTNNNPPPTEPTPPTGNKSLSAIEQAPSAIVAIKSLPSVTKIVPAVGGNALIVDDGSGVAIPLSEQLIADGFKVNVLQPAWIKSQTNKPFNNQVNVVELVNASDDNVEIDETGVKQALENIQTAQGNIDAVFYLHANTEITAIEYPQSAKQGLMLAFVLAKLCHVKGATTTRASFVVVTHQGGNLGFSNDDFKAHEQSDLVQAGLNGLVKTLSHEWPTVFCRLIDLPLVSASSTKVSAAKAASYIYDEFLDADTSLIEVGYNSTLSTSINRVTLVAQTTNSYNLEAGNRIDNNAVFLVSGGAKGVTAHCVIELAKQYQASFILLGRSAYETSEATWAQGVNDEAELKKSAMQALIAQGEKPTPVKVSQLTSAVLANREIAQTLDAITAAGGKAHYVAADVTNAKSVNNAVAPLVKTLGDISGIIHGAGVLADKFIEQKTLSEFNRVYRTKIDGLLSLLSCVDQHQLKHLVLFSSAAGFYGNPGQSDYAIANEILNKTAYRFKALHPQSQVLSFNWGPWDGGMVTSELKRMFNDRGVYIIPLDAGAQLLVSELGANSNRCPQILVGNDLSKDSTKTTENEQGAQVKKPQVSRLSNRVIKTLQVTNNAFLVDHTIGNDQVLPTVCALAWMSEACQASYQGYYYQGSSDYKLFKGVTFDEATIALAQAVDFIIEMNAQEQNNNHLQVEVTISSKVIDEHGNEKTIFHYGAKIHLAPVSQAKQAITEMTLTDQQRFLVDEFNSDAAKQTVAATNATDQAQALYNNGTLFHGESLQGIHAILHCDDTSLLLACQVAELAQVKQGDFPLSANKDSDVHNIFANDLVYQAMLVWVKQQLGLGSLPSSTQQWTVYRQVALNERFYLLLNVVKATGSKSTSKRGSLVADIQLFSEDYQLLADVKSAKVTASATLNNVFLPENTLSKSQVTTKVQASSSLKENVQESAQESAKGTAKDKAELV
ncbi:hypothetical protein GCM10009111_23790 [Colwellia asteriadis]|uniref:Uncharacterized protein n=1 Tax=Colwellia asteriadis TaxID=517723 RepID=A0ABN1L936_9GAMM